MDETLAQILEANRAAASAHSGPLPLPPARRLAVVTCMDARIDPLGALGLQRGDAHVIRVAGARAGEDVLSSLAVSAKVGT
ncbi:MAG: carbonic anhydrase, partial [Solirubrobacteraceae bacterium]